MTSVTVVIPSRVQPNQIQFLACAIGSVEAQRVRDRVEIEVLVAIDPDAAPPLLDSFSIPLRVIRAEKSSGPFAVNAAAAEAKGDYLAILEDDDSWDPNHLGVSLQALEHCAFVSGTQLEVDPEGTVVRINDFATPDSWVMPRETWDRVGPLDTSYRYHADNEWLGRLSEHRVPRVHLVESTAPHSLHLARPVRPWLAKVITLGGGDVRLERHDSPVPLVRRLVHAGSGMQRISVEPETGAVSASEYVRLTQRYGRIPW